MEVKFLQPTDELIDAIAVDMRQADIDEIWASHHYEPREALIKGWESPGYSTVITVNDEPCVMLGLTIPSILTDSGIPWLLGTENALKYKRHFLTVAPGVVKNMLDICPKLYNYVHVENKVSMNWLRRIGFKFDKPESYGVENELFCKFHLERV